MKRTLLTAWLVVIALLLALQPAAANELEQLKSRYRSLLLDESPTNQPLIKILSTYAPEREVSDQVVVDVQLHYPVTAAEVQGYMEALQPDGSWADINYQDKTKSGWDPKRHADRVLILAKGYVSPSNAMYHNEQLATAIDQAMGFWFTQKLICPNWWYNAIGIPKTMGEAFMLYEPYMDNAQKAGAIEVMKQSSFKGTGQNLVWETGNVLMGALLQNDMELVKECRNILMGEVVNERKEGIKPDWSFHQHGALQQFGNYGMSYIMSMGFYTSLFSNTSLAFTPEKVALLTDFINQGYRWTLWRGMLDVNTLTRQFYKNAPRDKGIGLGFAVAQLSAASNDATSQELLAENFPATETTQLIGNNYFWASDYGVHRAPRWMASVRCSSKRVIGTEWVNEDNILGYYVGDGVTMLYHRGDEYLNVMPLWDWSKLPGVTAWADNKQSLHPNKKVSNHSEFVGGVSNGTSGLWVMHLDRGDGLTAQKAWITTPDYMLCLGSNISTPERGAWTTIDQRLLHGKAQRYTENGWIGMGEEMTLEGTPRFYHDNVGYILLEKSSVSYSAKEQSGDWKSVMGFYKPNVKSGKVVTLQINHGEKPKRATYSYLLLPESSPERVAAFDASAIEVLQNDAKGKVVTLPNGDTFIEAVGSLRVKLPNGTRFATKTPALFLLSLNAEGGYDVVASDPTQQLKTVDYQLNGKRLSVSTNY